MLETFFALMLLLAATAAFPVFVLVDTCATLRAAGLYQEGEVPRKPAKARETKAAHAAHHNAPPREHTARKAS